jgi:hypothetical protein
MRAKTTFAGGVVSHLRVRDVAIAVAPSIGQNTKDTLRGVQQAAGRWREPGQNVKNVVGLKDILNGQAALALQSLTLRFTILFRLMVVTEATMC